MASAVLAKRYSAAPGRPSSANQNNGATTESLRFSASDSMADSRTCTAVSALTSRLTSRASCARPAGSDWPSATSTASNPCSISPSFCAAQPSIKTIAASAHQTSAARQNSLKSRATGIRGAKRSPHHCSARPIQTTGCQAAGGSPSHQSTASASSGTPIHTATMGQPPAGVSNKSQWSDTAASRIFDAALRGKARLERVLDQLHLGHGVGQLDDLGGAAAAGEAHVHVLGPIAQGLQHAVERQPAVDQRVGDLVQHHQKMLARQDGGARLFPAVARELGRVLQVLALPAEAVAQPLDGQADLLEHAVLAKARRGHLHELEDLHSLAPAMGAQRQAKGGRAFALAVAGVDDDEAPAFALGFFVAFFGRRGFDLHGVDSFREAGHHRRAGCNWGESEDGRRACRAAPAIATRAMTSTATIPAIRSTGLDSLAVSRASRSGWRSSNTPMVGTAGAEGGASAWAGGAGRSAAGGAGCGAARAGDCGAATAMPAGGVGSTDSPRAACSTQRRTLGSSAASGAARVSSRYICASCFCVSASACQ